MTSFQNQIADLPLVAILRGLHPSSAINIASSLVDAGFRVIEVPLNSPEPFETIRMLADRFGGDTMIGAGTVMTPDQVDGVARAGGTLVVMPHSDKTVIAAAKASGMTCVPGVATPTEAFAALGAGADALKLFPAEALPPPVVKAWRAVMAPDIPLLPVGGIRPDNMAPYLDVGASGFGLGSALFRPDMAVSTVAENARAFAAAYAAWKGGT